MVEIFAVVDNNAVDMGLIVLRTVDSLCQCARYIKIAAKVGINLHLTEIIGYLSIRIAIIDDSEKLNRIDINSSVCAISGTEYR